MKKIMIISILLAFFTSTASYSFAHCDSRNGPVMKATREALRTNNVNLVLIWVQEKFESEIKNAFTKTLAVRKTNAEVQALADEYFFETVVRLHRLGEGESYTGLKDEDPEPSILMAERAIERKSADSILNDINALVQQELDKRLLAAINSYYYNPADVKAGREYVARYIKFIRYVEGLYKASSNETPEHFEHEDDDIALIGVVPGSDLNKTGWTDNQFNLLVLSVLILMALLMAIVLLLNKTPKPKIHRHDLHNGMA